MNINVENSKAQLRKGVLEMCILSLLAEKDMYVSDILDAMKSARLIVVEGTLYPLLSRLKNDNLLAYRWEESKMGPPRKYYRLTDEGKVFLKELKVSWSELVNSVETLINK